MKRTFTWGKGLIMVMILFAAALGFFFIFSSSNQLMLVEDDYYEEEIQYQKKIDKIRKTEQLTDKVTFKQKGDTMNLHFPVSSADDSIKGILHFYRPSDSRLDVFMPLQPDTSGLQQVDLGKLHRGKYLLKLDWKMNGLEYYQEHTLILN